MKVINKIFEIILVLGTNPFHSPEFQVKTAALECRISGSRCGVNWFSEITCNRSDGLLFLPSHLANKFTDQRIKCTSFHWEKLNWLFQVIQVKLLQAESSL